MPVHIKPQDKTPLQKVEFQIHPAILSRLAEYAKSLDDSDPSYVIAQILDQSLPTDKVAKPRENAPSKRPSRTKTVSAPDPQPLKAVGNA